MNAGIVASGWVGILTCELHFPEAHSLKEKTAACVAREHREVERLLDEAERWLRGQEWEVTRAERLLVDPED